MKTLRLSHLDLKNVTPPKYNDKMQIHTHTHKHIPVGGLNLNFDPSSATSSSVNGLNDKLPPNTKAVTNSGEVTNACVAGLASLRPVKLRLYDETIVFLSPFFVS